jgi:hypothetical protein
LSLPRELLDVAQDRLRVRIHQVARLRTPSLTTALAPRVISAALSSL